MGHMHRAKFELMAEEIITVSVAGKNYTISSLSFFERSKWRSAHGTPILKKIGVALREVGIYDALPDAAALSATLELDERESDETKPSKKGGDVFVQGMYGAIRAAIGRADLMVTVISEMLDAAFDAVVAFSPDLRADKDHINKHCTEQEIIDALVAMLKAVFPLGQLLGLLRLGG